MAFPILRFTEDYLKQSYSTDHVDDAIDLTLLTDPLFFITSLVLGILGLTGMIAMPAAAGYALIGVSSGIALLYIGAILKICYFDSKSSSNPIQS